MKKVCGIYRIVCSNGGYYYGSSSNIWKRWYDHKRELNKNIHCNSRLQHTWNKYGEPAFRIELVELVLVEHLLEIENKYLQEHVGHPHCFNIASDAIAPARGLKFVVSYETRRKISEAQKGKLRGPRSEEVKRRISEKLKGRILSIETRQKISDAKKGVPVSEAHKLALQIAGKAFGPRGSPSEETRRKISESEKRTKTD